MDHMVVDKKSRGAFLFHSIFSGTNSTPRGARYFTLAMLLSCAHAQSFAGDWEIAPVLSVTETYSDNITLSSTPEDEYVTEVRPGITIKGEGARVKADLKYSAQGLVYARNSDRNNVNHNLASAANVEVVKEHFFVDASAGISQQLISSDSSAPVDNISIGNRTDRYTLSISPYYQHSIAGLVNTSLRYTGSLVRYDEGASDSDTSQVDLNAASGRKFNRFTWSANYHDATTDRETAADVEHETSYAIARYRLVKSLSFLVQGGNERHNFNTTLTRPIVNGSYWGAGITWQPNQKFSLDLSEGNNFKSVAASWTPTVRTGMSLSWRDRSVGLNPGEVWSANLSVRSRRLSAQLNYKEDTVSVQEASYLGEFGYFYIPGFADGILAYNDEGKISRLFEYSDKDLYKPLVADPTLVSIGKIEAFGLTDDIYTTERGQLVVGYKMAKSNLTFSAFNEDRYYQVSGRSESLYGNSISFNWRFGGRSTLMMGTSWQQHDYSDSDREDDYTFTNVGIKRSVNRKLDTSLTYGHTDRNSTQAGKGYVENRLALNARLRF